MKNKRYLPYEINYNELIGEIITLKELNEFTDELFHNHMKNIKSMYRLSFDFNNLSEEKIIDMSIEQELTPENNILMFDVIDYEPTDYKLCLSIELLKTGKIRIVNVSAES